MKQKRSRIEVSKKILIFCDVLLTLSLVAIFYALFKGVSVGDVAPVLISLVGLSATAHSFYYWKAKAENLHKYKQDDKIQMEDNSLRG